VKQYILKPFKSAETMPFWEGIAAGKFLAQQCTTCGEQFFPPRNHCPACLGKAFTWFSLSGRGTLVSWSRVKFPVARPYILGVVDLAEGVGRAIGRVNAGETQLAVGQVVKVSFAEFNGEPMFQFDVAD